MACRLEYCVVQRRWLDCDEEHCQQCYIHRRDGIPPGMKEEDYD